MQKEDKHHSIRINQDATVGDLINKIKESKEIVGNGQFLYLRCKNGGPNNGILGCKETCFFSKNRMIVADFRKKAVSLHPK